MWGWGGGGVWVGRLEKIFKINSKIVVLVNYMYGM
jgi:hypothetical protein